ncbi:MAG: LPS-assembly protein LptD [Chlamydiae bacterium]|nr:LPS-assembly protein LptD [Chlamydiota bacterium]MBI3265914.1 LPS-assembly protein LptD [Chlamydiota bacterium]
MKRNIAFLLFIFGLLSFSSHAFAQDLPIEVNADSLDYDREEGIATGIGHVVVTYQDTTLLADKGFVNLKTKEAHAEGHVQIIQKDRRLVGDALDYNFGTGYGEFKNASSYYAPWYAKGEKVIRYSKTKYEIQKGYITTCDYPNPHYRLRARRVDIYPGNKLVAHHVFFVVGKVPIFWLPYYVHSLKKSPWTFIPGYSKRWGAFFLSSFNWLDTQYVDSDVRLDYRFRRGLGVGVDAQYLVKNEGGGDLKTYYIHDRRYKSSSDGSVRERDRYRVSLNHYQSWKYDTTLRGQFHKLSDEDVLLDFFHRDSDYSVKPPTFFDITKYDSKYTARLFVQKRVNNFFTEVERLPEASLEFRRQRIMKTPFYYTSLSSASNLSKKFADADGSLSEIPNGDTTLIGTSQDAMRFDTYDEISYPKKFFGWVETNTWFGVRQTWYSRDLIQSDSLWRGSFSEGVEVGTKIHKIYGYENPKWDIHDLRHVIEPRVKYTYIKDPTVAADPLIQFDQVDALTGQNTIRPSIRNKLQTKRNNQVWDLIDYLIYIDYFVTRDPGQKLFSDIFGDLELRPLHHFSLDLDYGYNHYENRFSSFNIDIATFREGYWRAVTGVRFLDHESAQWTWGLDFRLNSDWAFKAYHRWEFEMTELQDQEYTISRDLHCWQTAFTFRKTGEDIQFWITFWLTSYPDLHINVGD